MQLTYITVTDLPLLFSILLSTILGKRPAIRVILFGRLTEVASLNLDYGTTYMDTPCYHIPPYLFLYHPRHVDCLSVKLTAGSPDVIV